MNKNSKLPPYSFGWKAAFVMVSMMLAFTFAVAMADVVSMLAFHKNLEYSDLFMMVLNTSGLLGAIFGFDYFCCRPETGRPLNFNLSTANFSTYLLIFPMMFGMMLIAEFFTSHIPVTGPVFGELYDQFSKIMGKISADTPTMIVMTVFLAPVLEEMIFRGIIMKGLLNKGWKPWSAILLSAVVFGIVHGNPWQLVGAVLLGCVLGVVYFKTKSLLLPMFLHAFNNLCSCLLIIFTKNESFAEAFHVSQWLVLLAGVVIFGAFYYLFTRKYRVHYSEK